MSWWSILWCLASIMACDGEKTYAVVMQKNTNNPRPNTRHKQASESEFCVDSLSSVDWYWVRILKYYRTHCFLYILKTNKRFSFGDFFLLKFGFARSQHGTYCSKIITDVLQQYNIGGLRHVGLLYMSLGGRKTCHFRAFGG